MVVGGWMIPDWCCRVNPSIHGPTDDTFWFGFLFSVRIPFSLPFMPLRISFRSVNLRSYYPSQLYTTIYDSIMPVDRFGDIFIQYLVWVSLICSFLIHRYFITAPTCPHRPLSGHHITNHLIYHPLPDIRSSFDHHPFWLHHSVFSLTAFRDPLNCLPIISMVMEVASREERMNRGQSVVWIELISSGIHEGRSHNEVLVAFIHGFTFNKRYRDGTKGWSLINFKIIPLVAVCKYQSIPLNKIKIPLNKDCFIQ